MRCALWRSRSQIASARVAPDVVVPLGGRQLARDDGRAAAVAVLEDLEEIASFLILHGSQAPVIEDEHVHAGELAEEAAVGAIGAREAESSKRREARR
jgi:hypothetical protein